MTLPRVTSCLVLNSRQFLATDHQVQLDSFWRRFFSSSVDSNLADIICNSLHARHGNNHRSLSNTFGNDGESADAHCDHLHPPITIRSIISHDLPSLRYPCCSFEGPKFRGDNTIPLLCRISRPVALVHRSVAAFTVPPISPSQVGSQRQTRQTPRCSPLSPRFAPRRRFCTLSNRTSVNCVYLLSPKTYR